MKIMLIALIFTIGLLVVASVPETETVHRLSGHPFWSPSIPDQIARIPRSKFTHFIFTERFLCNEHEACNGDTVLYMQKGQLTRGVVTGIYSDTSAEVTGLISAVPLKVDARDVAVTKPGSCLNKTTDVCVGSKARWSTPSEGQQHGVIAAYFPDGRILIRQDQALLHAGPELKTYTFTPPPVTLKSLASKSGPVIDFDPWDGCRNPAYGGHAIQIEKEKWIRRDCMPDTLYVWGPEDLIPTLRAHMSGDRWRTEAVQGQDALLWLSRTPASTFGYGSRDESGGLLARVKLKPGVRFKLVDAGMPDCWRLPEEEIENTVYVRTDVHPNNVFRAGPEIIQEDFGLCSTGPVHSWSFARQETFDELLRDVSRNLTAPPNETYTYTSWKRPGETEHQMKLFHQPLDYYPFTQHQLINTLGRQRALVDAKVGAITFAPGVSPRPEDHFSTRYPIWFNPTPGKTK